MVCALARALQFAELELAVIFVHHNVFNVAHQTVAVHKFAFDKANRPPGSGKRLILVKKTARTYMVPEAAMRCFSVSSITITKYS